MDVAVVTGEPWSYTDEPMDMTKFRPNIVLSGAEKAYEEDYWANVNVNGIDIQLAHNCVRCASLNVDYKTGKPGKGESGKVLAKLQKDRRVDAGHKWSPVFGRYCFWKSREPSKMLSVGDEVRVTRVNKERTKFSKSICLKVNYSMLTSNRLARTVARVYTNTILM